MGTSAYTRELFLIHTSRKHAALNAGISRSIEKADKTAGWVRQTNVPDDPQVRIFPEKYASSWLPPEELDFRFLCFPLA